MFLTLPTMLTWARIVAIPLIVAVFYLPWSPGTDQFDGGRSVCGGGRHRLAGWLAGTSPEPDLGFR
jgi:phosphatidylglycerophosphate synthase